MKLKRERNADAHGLRSLSLAITDFTVGRIGRDRVALIIEIIEREIIGWQRASHLVSIDALGGIDQQAILIAEFHDLARDCPAIVSRIGNHRFNDSLQHQVLS
ncbi:MAG: hypothetical protein ACPGLY_17105 [Rubripirellula sp.]